MYEADWFGNGARDPPAMSRPSGHREDGTNKEPASNAGPSPPAVSLPKGAGAIRGMGEKVSANPVTGTGSLSVPIYTSPGRSGFGPQLSLSYDSGAGNGPFGLGWNLSLPSITRKTDKGLPKYQDAEESDVFILSGAEDLVPVLVEDHGPPFRRPLRRSPAPSMSRRDAAIGRGVQASERAHRPRREDLPPRGL